MTTAAVLGASELGATVARLLAEAESFGRVVIVDRDGDKAKGKALDLLQSGPVEGYDTRIEARAVLEAVGHCDAVVVADPPELASTPLLPSTIEEVCRSIARSTEGPVIVALSEPAGLIEAAMRHGMPRDRVLGSVSLAFAGAVKRLLAEDLHCRAADVALSVLGTPPREGIVPQSSVTCGGAPLERFGTPLRRAVEAARRRALGPVALAAAARRALHALSSGGTFLSAVVGLDGEFGYRGIALSVPLRLSSGRIDSIVEHDLDPIDRVAFDAAAERRRRGGGIR